MTATPTPLRELLAEMRDTAFAWTHSAGYGDVMDRYADRLEATLSARDEAGAVGSAYDGLCPCCGEIECEEPATQPASGDAGAVCRVCDGGPGNNGVCLCGMREYATPPAASGGEPWSTISDSQVEAYIEHRSGLTKTLAKALRDTREHYRRLAAVAPAGMVLVPIVPTKEMLDATKQHGPLNSEWSLGLVGYQQMIAAAPTPPATAGEEGPKRCDLGMGCDEAGVCFASAHGQPDRCPRGIE